MPGGPLHKTFLKRLFGREQDDDQADGTALPEPAERRAAAGSLYHDIGIFLANNDLDPSPANYNLAYQYLKAEDSALLASVDEAISRDGRLTQRLVESLLLDRQPGFEGDSLIGFVERAESQLHMLGELMAQSTDDARSYNMALDERVTEMRNRSSQAATIASLISLTAAMIEKSRAHERKLQESTSNIATLRQELEVARQSAESDVLTGLANRRAFESRLAQAARAAETSGRPLTLAFVDIDCFKQFNDSFGHEAGDTVIRFVGSILAQAAGSNFFVARHGGEEFVLLFPDTEAIAAYSIIDRARQDLAGRRLASRSTGANLGQVTFSAGVASLLSDGPRAMLRRADEALYAAKRGGRNQVQIAPAALDEPALAQSGGNEAAEQRVRVEGF